VSPIKLAGYEILLTVWVPADNVIDVPPLLSGGLGRVKTVGEFDAIVNKPTSLSAPLLATSINKNWSPTSPTKLLYPVGASINVKSVPVLVVVCLPINTSGKRAMFFPYFGMCVTDKFV
jgi:hypothetical protein